MSPTHSDGPVSVLGDDTLGMDAGCIPPLPDIGPVLARLAKQRRQCQIGDGSVMSPMDEALWFNTPQVTIVTVPTSKTQLLLPNPQRVGIIFWFNFPNTYSLDAGPGTSSFQVGQGGGTLVLGNQDVSLIVGDTNYSYHTGSTSVQLNSSTTTESGNTQDSGGGSWDILQPVVGQLSIHLAQNSNWCTICPDVTVQGSSSLSGAGFQLSPMSPSLTIRQAEFGPLASIGWTGQAVSFLEPAIPFCVLTIVELILKDWPACSNKP